MQQRTAPTNRESSVRVQKKELEKRQAALHKDYTSANRELNLPSDSVGKNRLKEQIADLEQEMDEVEAALESLEKSEKNPNRCHLQIAEKLPEIDFSKIKRTANKIIEKFGKDGGGAVFLLQNYHAMAGELFTAALREQLQQKTSDFKHHPIRFTAGEGSLDELGILHRLARRVGVQPIADQEEYITEIIQTICKSVQSGSIVFFELNRWENLVPQEQILTWFVNQFWQRLINQLPIISKDFRRIRFIAVMTCDKSLPSEHLKLPCFCTQKTFDPTKILHLPLGNWKAVDIEEWLETFSGLPDSEISRMAENIYQSSMKGIPQLARGALLKEFD